MWEGYSIKRSHSERAPVERIEKSQRQGFEDKPPFLQSVCWPSSWGIVGLRSSRTLRVGVIWIVVPLN